MILRSTLSATCLISCLVLNLQAVQEDEAAAPGPQEGVKTYVVRPGDSLDKIARSQGVEVDELIRLNGIDDPNRIRVGQELRLNEPGAPAADSPAEDPEESPAEEATPPRARVIETYRIQSGDTLSKVAKDHGMTLKALEAANPGIDPRRLRVGQEIRLVPATSNEPAPEAPAPSGEAPAEAPEGGAAPAVEEAEEEAEPAGEKAEEKAEPAESRVVRGEGDFIRSLAMPSVRPESRKVEPVEEEESE